jgi:hypothetical protein
MRKVKNTVTCHWEEITGLLLSILQIASSDVKYSKDFEHDYMKRMKFIKQKHWKRYRIARMSNFFLKIFRSGN